MPGSKHHEGIPAGSGLFLNGRQVEIDIPGCRARGCTQIAHGDQPVTCGRCLRIKEPKPAPDVSQTPA